MADLAESLDREVAVLADRLRPWSASRWRAAAPPYAHRHQAAFALAVFFAELADAPASPAWVAEHVVADQIAVTGHDLAGAADDASLRTALAELARTRTLLGI